MAEGWEPYLQSGETLLWEGAPLPGIRNRARLAFLSLFGLPFLLVGLFGSTVALRQIFWLGEVGLGLFLLPVTLVVGLLGFWLAIGQWVEAARAHRTTRYALSTRCAYIARTGRKRALHSYPILPRTALELEHGPGYDTVWFHSRSEDDTEGGITTARIGFEGIADGTEVYRLMRGIQTGRP